VLPFGRLWYGEPNAVINAIEAVRISAQVVFVITRLTSDET
jgi:hypothetical protein